MFEIGQTYWFTLKAELREFVTLKGKVLEENQYMVRMVRDDGQEEIIPFTRILNVNRERKKV